MPLALQQTGANRDRRAPSAPDGGLAWRRGLVTAFMQIQPRRRHLSRAISRLLPDKRDHAEAYGRKLFGSNLSSRPPSRTPA